MHLRNHHRRRISPRRISQPRREAIDRIDDRRAERIGPENPMLRVGPIELQFGGLLFLILIVAAILRFAGIGWGANYYLHPDERYVTMVTTAIRWPHNLHEYFDSATSPLNPYNNDQGSYLYGTFPLFLTKLIGLLTGNSAYGNAHLPGRWLSALSDVGTVAMAAWAARMLANRLAGILTALLLTFTALMIQTAHYATVDSIALFFVTTTFSLCLYASRQQRFGWFALAGLMLGLAVASKPNALITLGFLALPVLEEIRTRGWQSLMPRPSRMFRSPRPAHAFPILLATLLALVVALLTFRFTQPYAFAGPSPWSFRLDPRWTSALSYWSQMQANKIDYPPSIQWANRTPVVFMVENMVRWSMFPAFGITALIALGIGAYRILFSRRWPSWWLLGIVVWCGFHIVYYGSTFVKTQRYVLPAFPQLAILSGILLAQLVLWARRRGDLPWLSRRRLQLPSTWPKWSHPGYILPVLVVAITAFYGVAYTNIFLQPLSRIEASAWMYENIPAGSTITSEYWDDGLPYCVPDVDCSAFVSIQTYPYADETEGKIDDLVGTLNRADYVIISSRRLVDSISRMPYRYPAATAYYRALFSGDLGFDLVKTIDSPPRIGPIRIDDRTSEESLTVYEHPTVYIFKKSDRWNYHSAWTYLDDALLQSGAINLRPVQGSPSMQMLDAQGQNDYYLTGNWSDLFDRFPAQLTSHWPAVWWYLALQLLSLPAIPILWRLLGRLPDRGYALAKTFGLVGVSYIAWMIASLRPLPFGPIPIVIGWLVMAGLALFMVRGDLRRTWLEDVRMRWLWAVGAEVFFLAVFLIAVWIRSRNPDLWHPFRGGEKPIDLAFFVATIRTPYFPPYDPWFSGGTIHYYYWGLVPWAVLTRLTRIVPEVSYNLAIPSIFALLMLNTWSVTVALISRLIPALTTTAGTVRRHLRLIGYGLLGPLLVGLLGNLQLIRAIGQGYQGARAKPEILAHLGGFSDYVWGVVLLFVSRPALQSNAYWDPTRVIPGTVNEFPYFSFLFGDLHPHYLALPFLTAFLIVVVAFAYAIAGPKDIIVSGANAIDHAYPVDEAGLPATPRKSWELLASLGGWRQALIFAVLGGFFCGMLMTSNSWYYPPALLILVGVAVVTAGTQFRWTNPWLLVRDLGVFTIVALVCLRILWQPYLSHYGTLPSATEMYRDTQTTISDFLAINSVLIFAIASYLGLELARLIGTTRRASLEENQQPFGAINASFGAFLLIGRTVAAVILNSPSVLLVGLLIVVAIVIWYRQQDRVHLVLLGMIGLGLVLLLVTDWIRLADDIGRMNTVFKLSLMAWVLLGVAGSVGLAMVIDSFQRRTLQGPEDIAWNDLHGGDVTEPAPASRGKRSWGYAIELPWRAAFTILIVMAIAYPVVATPLRWKDRFTDIPPTLNGFAYLQDANLPVTTNTGQQITIPLAPDLAGATWLRDHAGGLPVILEAQTAEYQWGGRISAMTGIPTVIGWSQQERLQRPGFDPVVMQRIADVTTIYGGLGTFASVSPLLDKYHVQLIYVGELERATYGAEALSKFDVAAATSNLLDVLFQQDGVTIYSYVPQPWPPEGVPAAPATPAHALLPAVATPDTSPVASPEASPVGTRTASTRTSPEASPAASPQVGTPAVSPPSGTAPATPAPTIRPTGSPVGAQPDQEFPNR